MCFSAEADLLGGLVIGAIGLDVLRHVDHRSEYRMLAALPLIFAFHQLTEAFVWWGLQGHVSATVGSVATWLYLLVAFVLIPVYVPLAVRALEPPGRRRRSMEPFVALGTVVAVVLFVVTLRGTVSAELGDYHVVYGIGMESGLLIVSAYVVATCGSLLFSGHRDVAVFGVVNLIAVAFLARTVVDGLASMWCARAAISSAAFALHLRFAGTRRPEMAPCR